MVNRKNQEMLALKGKNEDYLISTEIIDFNNSDIRAKAEEIGSHSFDNTDLIRRTYEFVRDEIWHSADIEGKTVTCTASEVLKHKEGICYAKSHLLAALLRANGIPCGFCYQKLILDDNSAPNIIIHGLNGVYVDEINDWIRIDARGNKPGVDADFQLKSEKLAFEVREDLGEEDILVVFSDPDINVISKLRRHHTVEELFADLPVDLADL